MRDVDTVDRRPWLGRLGRAGLVAKGVLYGLVGVLAGRVAFGDETQDPDQQGAIAAIAEGPLGSVLLPALALGFGGYAVWRAAQAWTDSGDEDGLHRLALRISYVVRASLYGGLAAITGRQALAGTSSGQQDLERSLTARILDLPAGAAAIALVGFVLIGVGLYQGRQSLTRGFREDLRAMTRDEHRWVSRLGVAGHAARAVVFALMGWFLIRVAVTREGTDTVGLDGALAELSRRPIGTWLLGAVAGGLLLYGLYCLAEARYGRIRVDD